MAQREEPRRLDEDPFVVDLLALFCEWAENQLSPASYVWYRNYLRGLVDNLDQELRASRFKQYDVTRWLDANPPWGASGRRGAITGVKRAFSWAEQEGLVDRSPIAHMKRPAAPRRSTTLSAEQRRLILESASDQAFRDLLVTAELTGVQPPEVLHVTLHVQLAHFQPAWAGKATTRNTRGLTRSVMARMVPPFPAPSRLIALPVERVLAVIAPDGLCDFGTGCAHFGTLPSY
jgi:hypothetical protein